MADAGGHPVAAAWGEVLADMEATAASYEDDGWGTQLLHPGGVTVLEGTDDDKPGLDILIPDNEFDALQDRLGTGFAVDDYEVFTAVDDGFVYLLLALRDHDRRTAVFVPAYYSVGGPETQAMLSRANEDGTIHTSLRRLDGTTIEFSHDEPGLFQPSAETD